jgi:hypothetical protein
MNWYCHCHCERANFATGYPLLAHPQFPRTS